MPKMRVERVTSDDGQYQTVERDVNDRDVVRVATYIRPTIGHWREQAVGLLPVLEMLKDGDEGPLDFGYRLFVSALDKRATDAVRESIASASTLVTIPGVSGRQDCTTYFTPKQFCRAHNGILGLIETMTEQGSTVEKAEDSKDFGPWKRGAVKLCDSGTLKRNTDGTVAVA